MSCSDCNLNCRQGRDCTCERTPPSPLPFLDFSALEALGYAAFVVFAVLACIFHDWISQ